mmetsp:Transcript_71657/g.140631  ORF Transcript_71657/g.140631 Transcript_71657/m.140631 type:complete len:227 (+) Transcript_71657:123-803(+)
MNFFTTSFTLKNYDYYERSSGNFLLEHNTDVILLFRQLLRKHFDTTSLWVVGLEQEFVSTEEEHHLCHHPVSNQMIRHFHSRGGWDVESPRRCNARRQDGEHTPSRDSCARALGEEAAAAAVTRLTAADKRRARCWSLRAWSRGPARACTRTSATGQHAPRRARAASSTATTWRSLSASAGGASTRARRSPSPTRRPQRLATTRRSLPRAARVGVPRRLLRSQRGS